jgi:hypothetical protein
MATIIIDIPDEIATDVKQAICDRKGYQDEIEEIIDGEPTGNLIPNPQTKAQFAKAKAARWAKEEYIAWKVGQAKIYIDAAREEAEQAEIT